MGKLKNQIKAELKDLPFTLAKVIGGIMAVIGFTGVIIILTRKLNATYLDIIIYSILGIIGVSVFSLSSILFEKRRKKFTDFTLTAKEKRNISIISWLILVFFIGRFILITFILTT